MRKPRILAVLPLLFIPSAAALADATATLSGVDVLFSPNGGCQARIVAELAKAKKTIRIHAYSYTDAKIAKALLDAKKRGVTCEAILDKSNKTAKYSAATFLKNQGIPCLIDDRHAIAHSKIIIIDDVTVVTGSYNFTKNAEENNAENMLVLAGMPDVAKAYVENYKRHREHAP